MGAERVLSTACVGGGGGGGGRGEGPASMAGLRRQRRSSSSSSACRGRGETVTAASGFGGTGTTGGVGRRAHIACASLGRRRRLRRPPQRRMPAAAGRKPPRARAATWGRAGSSGYGKGGGGAGRGPGLAVGREDDDGDRGQAVLAGGVHHADDGHGALVGVEEQDVAALHDAAGAAHGGLEPGLHGPGHGAQDHGEGEHARDEDGVGGEDVQRASAFDGVDARHVVEEGVGLEQGVLPRVGLARQDQEGAADEDEEERGRGQGG